MEHFDNVFNNSEIHFFEFPELKERTTNCLNNLKLKVTKNNGVDINCENALTLLCLQISLHESNYRNLEFHTKLKILLTIFSRYVDKGLIAKRFEIFDEEIDLCKFKNTKAYIFG